MASSDAPRRRCAIYTRKSTEEGLDQAFNSLDAQREACAAYVISQQHEGWTLLADRYDDGGFSGGTIERPGLRQLLDAVKRGRIDIVVVYKIDRLTRSLADFAKIVEVLDAAETSFVSVTQAFNTTNSMGRLTLNVLLSFAQFEREVITERIRDKVAASKARGMWMGGPVALGYKVVDRKLIVVADEAATVRDIMQRYVATDCVRTLLVELQARGIVSKRTRMRDGSIRGGIPLKRGALYHLLGNRLYLGETVHKGTSYPGEHEAIVDAALFDAVQAKLASRNQWQSPTARKMVSLLAGMIRDDRGRPMSPTHTRNHGRRYRYYVANVNDDNAVRALRLPAGELDASVRASVTAFLCDVSKTRALIPDHGTDDVAAFVQACARLGGTLASAALAEARTLFGQLKLAIVASSHAITVSLSGGALCTMFTVDDGAASEVSLLIPTHQASFGHEPRLRLDAPRGDQRSTNPRLLEVLGRGFAARAQLLAMTVPDIAAMPTNQLRHLQRLARLGYLDPTTTRNILDGTQPSHLTARQLWRGDALPLLWSDQQTALATA